MAEVVEELVPEPGAKQEWTRSWLRRSAIPIPEQGLFNSRTRLQNTYPRGRMLARDRRRCSGSVRSPEFSHGRAEDGRERCGGGNDGLPGPRWACCLHKGVGHRGVSPAGPAPGTLVGVRPIGSQAADTAARACAIPSDIPSPVSAST